MRTWHDKNIQSNRSNVIKAFENRVFPFKYGFQKEKPNISNKALPNWVKVSKKRFDTIQNAVQNAKKDNLQARPQRGSPINFDNSNKLIQDIVHGNITYEEALNKMAGTNDNDRNYWTKKVLTQTKLKWQIPFLWWAKFLLEGLKIYGK